MLLAVNFHYIERVDRDPRHPYPAIFATAPEQLASQLEAIGSRFDFVGGGQIVDALDGKPFPERACLITFDDGLRSQFENALPVLDRLGVPALFFASPRPVAEARALLVHKIQLVRARLPAARILAAIAADEVAEGARRRALRTYRYDEPEAALAKWLLNFGLEPELAERRVGPLFAELVADEAEWCEQTYLARDALRALAARGWLGNHGWSHRPLARLGEAAMRADLGRSQAALEQIGGAPVRFVSYPYGGANAVGPREAAAASALGLRVGFTMERAFNKTLAQPLLLARVDTNDAPGGKRPLVDVGGSGITLREGMDPQRRLHLDEAAP